jgi:hypothetical protein
MASLLAPSFYISTRRRRAAWVTLHHPPTRRGRWMVCYIFAILTVLFLAVGLRRLNANATLV